MPTILPGLFWRALFSSCCVIEESDVREERKCDRDVVAGSNKMTTHKAPFTHIVQYCVFIAVEVSHTVCGRQTLGSTVRAVGIDYCLLEKV